MHVVILGAGFAGSAVARRLVSLLPADNHRITLVDQNDFFLFTPMLTEVAGGEVDPTDVAAALRDLDSRVQYQPGRVEKIDLKTRTVTLDTGVQKVTLTADHLVIALGSVTNYHDIPGLEQHCLTLKSLADAEVIRNRAIALVDRAAGEASREERRRLLTFVVGGGGFSGVETMAQIADLVRDLAAKADTIPAADIRLVIAHAGDRLVPELPESLASYTQRELQQRGVEVMLDTLINQAGEDFVEVKSKKSGHRERIDCATLIWTGGVKPNPAIDSSGLKLGHHGGILVDECCRVMGHANLWALGDCAEVPKGNGKTYAPTAQSASREGPLVARNIAAAINGRQPQPFRYKPVGQLALLGRRTAVAHLYGIRLSGLLAFILWRGVYLYKLPTFRQRLKVACSWFLDLTLGRELASLPGVPTRATHTRQNNSPSSEASASPVSPLPPREGARGRG